MTLGGSESSMHFQIWKHLHFLIGKVVSIVRGCFQGPGYMSKKGNLDVSDETISEKSEIMYNGALLSGFMSGSCAYTPKRKYHLV